VREGRGRTPAGGGLLHRFLPSEGEGVVEGALVNTGLGPRRSPRILSFSLAKAEHRTPSPEGKRAKLSS